MDIVVLIGRILFVALFLMSGIGHFQQTQAMAGYAQSKGVPSPRPAVLAGGVLLLLGAVLVLLGIWADLGALLLAVFLVPTAIMMHAFWKETDEMAKNNERVQFLKDMALAGAALMLFGFFAGTEDLGMTITGPLFGL
jgi:putative oxidoreductase